MMKSIFHLKETNTIPLQCWQMKVPMVMLMYVGPCTVKHVRQFETGEQINKKET